MINPNTDRYPELREAVSDLCERFGNEYWRQLDEAREYPEAFVKELTDAGWLSALIPEEYGGTGLGMAEASVILEQINRCGGNAGACHAQMYTMGTILRHGSPEQKDKSLPPAARRAAAESIAHSLVSGEFRRDQLVTNANQADAPSHHAKPDRHSTQADDLAETTDLQFDDNHSATLPGVSDMSMDDSDRHTYFLIVADICHQSESAL